MLRTFGVLAAALAALLAIAAQGAPSSSALDFPFTSIDGDPFHNILITPTGTLAGAARVEPRGPEVISANEAVPPR